MRSCLVLVAAALLLGACGTDGDLGGDSGSDGGSGFGLLDGGDVADLVDMVADAPCDAADVGEDEGPVESIYAVVDGALAGLCFGDPSLPLVEAWLALAAVAPPEQLEPVVLLGGFASDSDTVAFAGAADDEQYERFLIAIDLPAAEEQPDEMRLTMAHELSHVFTQTPDQLDVGADEDQCDVYWNGAGCVYADSYLALWIEAFWDDDDLIAQPEDGSADPDLGIERCELDPAFLGAYAASSPEEDLAESFSAFVFDLDVPAGVQPKMAWFEAFPELAAFRDLHRVSGLPEVPNTLDRCG